MYAPEHWSGSCRTYRTGSYGPEIHGAPCLTVGPPLDCLWTSYWTASVVFGLYRRFMSSATSRALYDDHDHYSMAWLILTGYNWSFVGPRKACNQFVGTRNCSPVRSLLFQPLWSIVLGKPNHAACRNYARKVNKCPINFRAYGLKVP